MPDLVIAALTSAFIVLWARHQYLGDAGQAPRTSFAAATRRAAGALLMPVIILVGFV